MSINKSELTDFYYNDLHDVLMAREAIRLKAKNNFSIARGLIVSFAILLFLGVPWLLLPIIILSCSLLYVALIKSSELATRGFAQEVITPLVKFVSKDLNYDAEGYIDYKLFTYSHLFHDVTNLYKNKNFKRDFYEGKNYTKKFYEGGSYIYGHLDNLKLACSKVRAKTNDDDRFHGTFLIVALPKPLSATTLIYPKPLNNREYRPPYANYKRVRLEDPKFALEFDVYTNDQVGARIHLTPTMMENILRLVDLLPAKPFLSFRGKRLHIAIPSSSLFSVPLLQSVFDPIVVDYFLAELNIIVTILETFNLTNTSTSAR